MVCFVMATQDTPPSKVRLLPFKIRAASKEITGCKAKYIVVFIENVLFCFIL